MISPPSSVGALESQQENGKCRHHDPHSNDLGSHDFSHPRCFLSASCNRNSHKQSLTSRCLSELLPLGGEVTEDSIPLLISQTSSQFPRSPASLCTVLVSHEESTLSTGSDVKLTSTLPTCFSCSRKLPAALCLVFVFATVFHVAVFPELFLFATTGSFFYQSYEWYSTRAACQRLYPLHFSEDGNYTDRARMELSMWTCPAPMNMSDSVARSTRAARQGQAIHLHIVVAEGWTLFPFLWDSIVVNDTILFPFSSTTPVVCSPTNECHKCPSSLSNDPSCHKWLPQDHLLVTLVNYPIDRQLLPSIRTLLVVGEHMEPRIFAYLRRAEITPFVRPDLQLAALMLTGEQCNSFFPTYDSLRRDIDERMTFVAQTYGDCRLNPHWDQLEPRSLPSIDPIDMQQRIVYWPLGPSVESGFPSRLPELEMDRDNDDERPLLVNMMVSITVEKPTRMQAWLEATKYCESLPQGACYLHSNDFISRVIRAFDTFTSLPINRFLSFVNPTITNYLPILSSSDFTLCPAGKNPEQYRIWEAIMAGSIPIVEDPAITETSEMHPAYGSAFRCTPVDMHRVLKKYGAPVVFVKDWRELAGIVNGMGKETRAEKRRELQKWFRELKRELERELVKRVRWLNQ